LFYISKFFNVLFLEAESRELKELLIAAEVGNIERMNCIFAATDQWDMTKDWLTKGDIKGRTILHFAAIYGYIAVASCMVDKIDQFTEDADERKQHLNVQDYKGRTPLFHAVAEGRLSVTKLLVERGADMEMSTNEKHVQPGSTPFMACCEKDTWECSKILLDNGASIIPIRKDGADAIYIAARFGHLAVIDQIAESEDIGLILDRPTFKGRTALLTAAFHGHSLVVRKLFISGSDIDHQDDYKFTALMYATKGEYFELVKWLLGTGANPTKKDADGKTALKMAKDMEHASLVKYLKMFEQDAREQKYLASKVGGKRAGGRVSYLSKTTNGKKIIR
jgi:ankyrin repeat protein